jgi:hypothetical protein
MTVRGEHLVPTKVHIPVFLQNTMYCHNPSGLGAPLMLVIRHRSRMVAGPSDSMSSARAGGIFRTIKPP